LAVAQIFCGTKIFCVLVMQSIDNQARDGYALKRQGESPAMTTYWWSSYGPFDADADGYPNAGQVVRHYRMLKGWTPAELGAAMGKSGRWVQAMEKDNTVPELISRRRAIAAMLGIPPLLLGLAPLDLSTSTELPALDGKINAEQMTQYHMLLRLYWELDYASSAQESMEDVLRWIRHLKTLAPQAGPYKSQILELLCRYHQLACWIARDRRAYETALPHANQAVRLASSLQNPELLAASLFRRGRTRLEQADYSGAVADLTAALPYAQKSRPQLRALVLLACGHAKAYLAQGPVEISEAFALIDQAAKIVRRGNLEEDESFVKLSVGRYHLDRADALIVVGRPEAGLETLEDATRGLSQEQTRRLAYANVLTAKAYAASGEVLMAVSTAEAALDVVQQINSVVNVARISEIQQQFVESKYGNHPDVRRLGARLVTRL
jgi:transcriptional regulator with XRE-family HTH domain